MYQCYSFLLDINLLCSYILFYINFIRKHNETQLKFNKKEPVKQAPFWNKDCLASVVAPPRS